MMLLLRDHTCSEVLYCIITRLRFDFSRLHIITNITSKIDDVTVQAGKTNNKGFHVSVHKFAKSLLL